MIYIGLSVLLCYTACLMVTLILEIVAPDHNHLVTSVNER